MRTFPRSAMPASGAYPSGRSFGVQVLRRVCTSGLPTRSPLRPGKSALFSAQTSQALEEILSGARKYKLFLGLAHQNFGQTDTRLKQALQNAETFAFKLNRDDAVWM